MCVLWDLFLFPRLSTALFVHLCASVLHVNDYIICLHTCSNVCCAFLSPPGPPRAEQPPSSVQQGAQSVAKEDAWDWLDCRVRASKIYQSTFYFENEVLGHFYP